MQSNQLFERRQGARVVALFGEHVAQVLEEDRVLRIDAQAPRESLVALCEVTRLLPQEGESVPTVDVVGVTVEQIANRRDGLARPKFDRACYELALALGRTGQRERSIAVDQLYRSAVDVGKEWAAGIRNIRTPGLVVIPSEDPFLVAECAERTAATCGAEVAWLEGLGHWWPLQAPNRGAEMLSRFWTSIG